MLKILYGIITISTFIFTVFPDSLEWMKKMDKYRLVALCIFIICMVYWIYLLTKIFIQHRSPIKVLMNLEENIHLIRNVDNGYCYLVEKDTCLHIPDADTLYYLGNYLGFSPSDLKPMTNAEIDHKFKKGRQLPSIQSHFPKTELKE